MGRRMCPTQPIPPLGRRPEPQRSSGPVQLTRCLEVSMNFVRFLSHRERSPPHAFISFLKSSRSRTHQEDA